MTNPKDLSQEYTLHVIALLKKKLREKSMNYTQLAHAMNISQSTIKRLLNGNDISLFRIIEICSHLDIEAAEILACATIEPCRKDRLYTFEEEQFFVDHPHHLGYFTELLQGKSPGYIAQKYHISKASTNLYLKNLERGGFIKIYPGHKIKILVYPLGSWQKGGPLMNSYMNHILNSIFKNFQEYFSKPQENNSQEMKHVWYWYCRKTTKENYIQEIMAITKKFMDTASREIQHEDTHHLEPFVLSLFLDSGEHQRNLFTEALHVKEL